VPDGYALTKVDTKKIEQEAGEKAATVGTSALHVHA